MSIDFGEKDTGFTLQPSQGPLNWDYLIHEQLEPWSRPGRNISKDLLDQAVLAFHRVRGKDEASLSSVMPTLHMAADVWRAQIVSGVLYLREVHLHWPWVRYSADTKLVLLETLRRHPTLPDLDLIFNQWDQPMVLATSWSYQSSPPPPVFSPTSASGRWDLLFPDFSFLYPTPRHRLNTPRWDQARRQILEASRRIRWEDKIDRAAFSGNGASETRKRAAEVAERHPEDIFMNFAVIFDDEVKDTTCFQYYHALHTRTSRGKLDDFSIGTQFMKGVLRNKCYMPFEEMCKFKYLVSISGNSYSNRLKYLLLCGSVVINVRRAGAFTEFYDHLLTPGTHFMQVEDVRLLPRVLAQLRADDSAAQRMAQRATQLMARMDMDEVCNYVAGLLTEYSKLQSFKPEPDPLASRINCEDDLWRRYGLDGSTSDINFLSNDPSLCIEPHLAGTPAPGRGRWVPDKERYHPSLDRFVPPGVNLEDLPPTQFMP